ncbi:MAG: DUF309 domain-containing protein [Deltaproteobacteria bacterium]|nr:DUF309 domain-containing protein [Deltaproteobacteria bacterium]
MDPAFLAALLAAAREFNSRRYFEAHEALEESLEDLSDDLWPLFLGLIQVSVGYHKVTQPLRPGAARMLEKGLEKLEPLAEDAGGVELDALRRRARSDLESLRAGRFDQADFERRPPRLIVHKDRPKNL